MCIPGSKIPAVGKKSEKKVLSIWKSAACKLTYKSSENKASLMPSNHELPPTGREVLLRFASPSIAKPRRCIFALDRYRRATVSLNIRSGITLNK